MKRKITLSMVIQKIAISHCFEFKNRCGISFIGNNYKE